MLPTVITASQQLLHRVINSGARAMNEIVVILTGFCVVLCAANAILTWKALTRAETRRLIALEKAVRELDIEVQGVLSAYETLRDTLKRINSRTAMREKRARDAQQPAQTDDGLPNPDTHPDEWRAAVQRKFPRGVFDYNRNGDGR